MENRALALLVLSAFLNLPAALAYFDPDPATEAALAKLAKQVAADYDGKGMIDTLVEQLNNTGETGGANQKYKFSYEMVSDFPDGSLSKIMPVFDKDGLMVIHLMMTEQGAKSPAVVVEESLRLFQMAASTNDGVFIEIPGVSEEAMQTIRSRRWVNPMEWAETVWNAEAGSKLAQMELARSEAEISLAAKASLATTFESAEAQATATEYFDKRTAHATSRMEGAFKEAKADMKKRVAEWDTTKALRDQLEKQPTKLDDLIRAGDRKGAVKLIRSYIPWPLMEPSEVSFWEHYLDAMENPDPKRRVIAFRGMDDDMVQRTADGKVFIMSTVLAKNQGNYTRRLRSFATMREKFATRAFQGLGMNTPATLRPEFGDVPSVATAYASHSRDPMGSPFISFSNHQVASGFGSRKRGLFLMDERLLTANAVSSYNNELELLAPLVTFPDDNIYYAEIVGEDYSALNDFEEKAAKALGRELAPEGELGAEPYDRFRSKSMRQFQNMLYHEPGPELEGILKDPKKTIAVIKDGNHPQHSRLLQVLRFRGSQDLETQKALVSLFRSPDPWDRVLAGRILADHQVTNPAIMASLFDAFDEVPLDAKVKIAEVLRSAEVSDKALVKELVDVFRKSPPGDAALLASVLAKSKGLDVAMQVEMLDSALKLPEGSPQRQSFLTALVEMQDTQGKAEPKVLKATLKMLSDPKNTAQVRQGAALASAPMLKTPEYQNALLGIIDKGAELGDAEVFNEVGAALGKAFAVEGAVTGAVRDRVIGMLLSSTTEQRALAYNILSSAEISDPETITKILAAYAQSANSETVELLSPLLHKYFGPDAYDDYDPFPDAPKKPKTEVSKKALDAALTEFEKLAKQAPSELGKQKAGSLAIMLLRNLEQDPRIPTTILRNIQSIHPEQGYAIIELLGNADKKFTDPALIDEIVKAFAGAPPEYVPILTGFLGNTHSSDPAMQRKLLAIAIAAEYTESVQDPANILGLWIKGSEKGLDPGLKKELFAALAKKGDPKATAAAVRVFYGAGLADVEVVAKTWAAIQAGDEAAATVMAPFLSSWVQSKPEYMTPQLTQELVAALKGDQPNLALVAAQIFEGGSANDPAIRKALIEVFETTTDPNLRARIGGTFATRLSTEGAESDELFKHLAKLLATSPDDSVRMAAKGALTGYKVKLKDPATLETLFDLLDQHLGDAVKRKDLLEVLTMRLPYIQGAGPELKKRLEAALKSPSLAPYLVSVVRQNEQLKSPGAIRSMVEAYAGVTDPQEERMLARWLGLLVRDFEDGEKLAGSLKTQLASKDPAEVRKAAALFAVFKAHDPETVPLLVKTMAGSKNPVIQKHVAENLKLMAVEFYTPIEGPKALESAESMLMLLKQADAELAGDLGPVLGMFRMGKPEQWKEFVDLLLSAFADSKDAAVKATLITTLEGIVANEFVSKEHVQQGLGKILASAKDADTKFWLHVMQAREVKPEGEALKQLLAALDGSERPPQVRLAAVGVLSRWEIPEPNGYRALVPLLDDASQRVNTLTALTSIKDRHPDVEKALVKVFLESDAELYNAYHALQQPLKDPSLLKPIVRLLTSKNAGASQGYAASILARNVLPVDLQAELINAILEPGLDLGARETLVGALEGTKIDPGAARKAVEAANGATSSAAASILAKLDPNAKGSVALVQELLAANNPQHHAMVLQYILVQPGWEQHPQLFEAIIQGKHATPDVVDEVAAYPHWAAHKEGLMKLKAGCLQNALPKP